MYIKASGGEASKSINIHGCNVRTHETPNVVFQGENVCRGCGAVTWGGRLPPALRFVSHLGSEE